MTNSINRKISQDFWPFKNTNQPPCSFDLSFIDFNQTTSKTVAASSYILTKKYFIISKDTFLYKPPLYTLLIFLGNNAY